MGRAGFCAVCGGWAPVRTRRRCLRCYQWAWRHGYDRPAHVDRLGTPRRCTLATCGTVTRALRRGFCPRHYMKLHRLGYWRWTRSQPMSLSAFPAQQLQAALDALAEQAAQAGPLPEMTRRLYEDACALIAQHTQERPGAQQRRLETEALQARGQAHGNHVWPPPTPAPSPPTPGAGGLPAAPA